MVIQAYELDGHRDGPARRETWNNWTDSLCKDGQISDWQYMKWSHPDYLYELSSGNHSTKTGSDRQAGRPIN